MLVLFVNETLIMFVLPYLLPDLQGNLRNFADSILLTLVSGPVIWFLIGRPLRIRAVTESARTEAVLESIADAVLTFDCAGTIETVNPAAERMFGYACHELAGQQIGRVIPAMTAPTGVRHGDAADQASAGSPGTEAAACHRNGTSFPVEVSLGSLATEWHRAFVISVHDLTHRKRVAAVMEEQREFLENLVQQSAVPTFVIDPDHRVLIWNRACEALTGTPAAELLGKGEPWQAFYDTKRPVLADIVLSGDLAELHENYHKSSLIAEGLQAEGWYRNLNGRDRYIFFNAAPIRNGKGELLAVIETLEDITERKRYEEQLEYQANYDALTGLANRNLLNDRLRQALLVSERSHQQVAIFVLDLDNFKLINDTLGHGIGDLLLKQVAERVAGCVRAGDTVAHQGGDEFVMVISGRELSDTVAVIASKILERITQPLDLNGHQLVVTVSIGISLAPKDGDDVQTLLKNAEVAMYRAKDQGGNAFQFYTGEMNAKSLARMTLESHLRRALERDEFRVYYQPKLSLCSGQMTGMEALVRWQSPDLGLVAPDTFIPLAEETGLIVAIGAWVLKTACAQNRAWQDLGLPLLTVAVNLSPRQFRQHNIASVIEQCLTETRLAPQFLELEITEGMVMQDVDRVKALLGKIKQMGVSLAMDDFGTGYSSLGYLKRFPFDKLKIDKSFIRDLTCDPDNAAIAKAIIAMAHTLHLKVIAEGVETQGQLNYLRGHGCDEMQGYFFSRPLPAADFEQLLRQDRKLSLAPVAEQGKTVLVVDDDSEVADALQELLQLEGYQVLTAGSASEGFEQLSLHRIAVVVSDLRMPGMNGAEFLGRVKGLYPGTVRIMLTGYADLDAVTEAVNVGAIYKFMTKPCRSEEVRKTIEDAFSNYHLLAAA